MYKNEIVKTITNKYITKYRNAGNFCFISEKPRL